MKPAEKPLDSLSEKGERLITPEDHDDYDITLYPNLIKPGYGRDWDEPPWGHRRDPCQKPDE